MAGGKRFKIPIPDGFRIFFGELEVAGTSHRKDAIKEAFSGDSFDLSLEPEPDNEYDENAIQVVVLKKGTFGEKRLHIGYVPAEVAMEIGDSGLDSNLLPRLKELWIGDRGGLAIRFDILGLKSDYHFISGEEQVQKPTVKKLAQSVEKEVKPTRSKSLKAFPVALILVGVLMAVFDIANPEKTGVSLSSLIFQSIGILWLLFARKERAGS